ncbi:MAG: DoxX family protein [Gammaproteobacteria bacterium]|nr:DoxX family protein [Gammaproteobacteria bacterium]MDE1888111.1 DoxX family protein [Gammaproteobacteria bacterium]MDE2024517.1 DoxX family protein [Gammaproteobacteria bacterium]MDE2140743.1 DoxX family protein [Gammaproteobacteria bacterium]MDE2274042.1 DoxX family protein [Gammaproteobacteria bacterium]
MTFRNFLDYSAPRVLSVLRIVVGLMFMEHGTSKLFHYPASMGHIKLFSLFGLAGILETFGGALIVLGLFTRPVAFILSGEMAFAYFMAHAPRGFFPLINQGEAAVFYCFVFLYFAAAGAGTWGLDAWLWRSRAARVAAT